MSASGLTATAEGVGPLGLGHAHDAQGEHAGCETDHYGTQHTETDPLPCGLYRVEGFLAGVFLQHLHRVGELADDPAYGEDLRIEVMNLHRCWK
jgi:hypothetical protein